MINLPYSLIIEATAEPDYFGFYSPDLAGFSGIGHSIEDCLYKARSGFEDHLRTMRELGLPIPPAHSNPTVLIRDEEKLQAA
jgi:predicted RNase H-like HicB family nuclease